MPKTGPEPVNRLGRYFGKLYWQGWREVDEHDDAKAFAKLCRLNGARARAVKLAESRTWHGALARSVIYVPKDQPVTEAETMRRIWAEMFGS